jgi:hypothetical protein
LGQGVTDFDGIRAYRRSTDRSGPRSYVNCPARLPDDSNPATYNKGFAAQDW